MKTIEQQTKELEERSEILKNKWKNERFDSLKHKCFVWDGIIDYSTWFQNDLKLMFLLKEAYSKDGEADWNIAIDGVAEGRGIFYVGNQANQGMQNRIAEWAFGIESAMVGKENITIEEALENDREKPRQSMMKSAWVNIQKIDGKSSSNIDNLLEVAKRDKDLLLEQLDLINPNIIFCGKTFEIIQPILFNGIKKIEETSFCYEWNDKLVVNFRHPSRASKETLLEIFNDIKKIPQKEKYRR